MSLSEWWKKKKFQKTLDKIRKKRYNIQAFPQGTVKPRLRALKKLFEKSLEKVLTRQDGCGIIVKLSAKAGSESVIEN